MIINFTKMHSLGNDFIIIDTITQNIKLHNAYIKKIANRHIGIGCDQVILIEPPIHPLSDFYYKIYNSNGKIAEQCLNGARCAARFALDAGLVNKKIITADCLAGQVIFTVEDNQSIAANLGNLNPIIDSISLKLKHLDKPCQLYNLSIGNPHAIYLINFQHSDINQEKEYKELDHQIYSSLAEDIANQDMFSQGINIGFAKIVDYNTIQLRVFERGAGETLSCGTNAVAAFVVAKHLHLIDNQAKILFKLGNLQINLDNNDLIIKGPTNSIFTGKFKI